MGNLYDFQASGYEVKPEQIDGNLLNEIGSVYREAVSTGLLPKNNANVYPLVRKPFRGTKARSYLKFSLGNATERSLLSDATVAGGVDLDTTNIRVAYHNRPFVHLTTREDRDMNRDFEFVRELFGRDLSFKPTTHDGYIEPLSFDNYVIYSADLTKADLKKLDFRELDDRVGLHSIGWGNGKDMEDPAVIALGTGVLSPASSTFSPLAIYLPDNQHMYGLGFVVTTEWMSAQHQEALEEEARSFREKMLELVNSVAVPETIIVGTSSYNGPNIQMFTPETNLERVVGLNIGGYDAKNLASSTERLTDYYNALLRTPNPGPQYAANLLSTMENVHDKLPEPDGKSPSSDAKRDLGFTIEEILHPEEI